MPKKKPSERFLAVLDDAASKEEVTATFKELTDFLKKFKKDIEQKTAQNKAEMAQMIEERLPSIQAIDAGFSEKLGRLSSESKSDARTTMRYIEQSVNELRAELPESYDDSEIRALINEVKTLIPQMPKEFDASDIIKRLDAITEEMKELRDATSKVRGTVGGVTNARIQQAFKYILKTETPVGDIDGNNLEYTVSQPIFAVLAFSLSGEVIPQIPNYTINGRKIVFSTALPADYSGSDFEVKYI